MEQINDGALLLRMPRKPQRHSGGQLEGIGGGSEPSLAKDKTGPCPLMAKGMRVGAGTWTRATLHRPLLAPIRPSPLGSGTHRPLSLHE